MEPNPNYTVRVREGVKAALIAKIEKGRCWGSEFCSVPAQEQPVMDGCYYCGRQVEGLNGNHNHTEYKKGDIAVSVTTAKLAIAIDYATLRSLMLEFVENVK